MLAPFHPGLKLKSWGRNCSHLPTVKSGIYFPPSLPVLFSLCSCSEPQLQPGESSRCIVCQNDSHILFTKWHWLWASCTHPFFMLLSSCLSLFRRDLLSFSYGIKILFVHKFQGMVAQSSSTSLITTTQFPNRSYCIAARKAPREKRKATFAYLEKATFLFLSWSLPLIWQKEFRRMRRIKKNAGKPLDLPEYIR